MLRGFPRIVGLASALCACGPGLAQVDRDPQVVGRNAVVAAAGDPVAFERLVRGPVVNGGLWFDDPKCSGLFSLGEVPEPHRVAFAHCLAGLKLQRSTREDALGDAIVLEYGRGFEVEARVVLENDGPRLTWIGFESRRSDSDNAPTITLHALEQLRAAGDPSGPIDPAVASTIELDPTPKSHAAFAWFKVCIDDIGSVNEIYVHEMTSVKAKDAFLGAIQTWKFQPFVIEGQAVPVCAMVRMTYPYGQGPVTEVLPLPPAPSKTKRDPFVFAEGTKHALLEGHRIAGQIMIAPDDETKKAIHNAGIRRVMGTFRLCMDETGKVETVLPLRSTGVASYDRRIIGGMLAWRYSPYMIDGRAVAVCTAITYIYTQR